MSDTLKKTLEDDLHTAMRARDRVRVGTLRMALTAITNEEVSGETARVLTDVEVMKVLGKEAKKRRESAAAYELAQRPALVAQEVAELAVLEGYLPTQLGDDAIARTVEEVIAATGAIGMPQLGMVMKAVQAQLAGQADGGRVAAIVKAKLTGK